ncbi:MAG: UDP-N-acetylmuramoyl-tripeptide--D-alanyl-D-alanine ligase [Prevotellaceae bacterium]|nr:UDP-N-acetylmuramoyl-tripeptide--D-alanyl-D-alanine ligase [Prevotellaceae bacterium]MDO4931556.1 UDP-N-acetylmuramoyl-tripeptide--D-alanyl-D-alanine ligase [Prevotellaceae bacterium]
MSTLYSLFLQHPVITTDSRDCPAGSIFFALKGESFNGNAYAAAALHQGCAYAVIDEEQYATDSRCILVPDVLTALQQLANEHRRALGTRIIGVTGTNGKTTTKELIAAVLQKKYRVLYTQGNFNNHIGVPKTLLRLTAEDEIAVVEMGANHPGEIKTLADIVEPDCGIITNVGMGHLEGFGSFEGVLRTKGELYDKLRNTRGSCVFIDADNPHLAGIVGELPSVKYAVNTDADDITVKGEVIDCAPFLHFRWRNAGKEHEVMTHLVGAYNIYNMLAAATIGLHFGVTAQQVCKALADYVPSNNRSQLTITEHNKLIVDTYNANPTSMAAALHNFCIMQVEPKMAILGDMGELGAVSHEEHQKVVDYLMSNHIDNVWLVGHRFAMTDCTFRKFPDVEAVKKELKSSPVSGQYILIKGSNANRLFELPELL